MQWGCNDSIYLLLVECLPGIPTRCASCICYPPCVRAVRKEKNIAAKIPCIKKAAYKRWHWDTINAGTRNTEEHSVGHTRDRWGITRWGIREIAGVSLGGAYKRSLGDHSVGHMWDRWRITRWGTREIARQHGVGHTRDRWDNTG